MATSPTAIRSEATSRARNSMSACARALAWRSCSAITLSRCSWRFCASRISGAAYDACRLSIRVRKMNGYSSKRRSARRQRVPDHPDDHEQRHVDQEARGAHEAGELLGEDAERVGVVRRAAHERATGVARGVEARARGCRSPATSGTGARPGRGARSRQPSGSMWSSRSSTVTAPSRRPSSSTTGRRDEVVGRQVGGHLVHGRVGAQRVHRVVERGGDQRRGRLAQQALDVGGAEEPAGRASPAAGGRRRPARPAPG